ncbi:MAG: galactose-1-phosphate uridylyltransferase [Candidatus Omnitrophota bacterium]
MAELRRDPIVGRWVIIETEEPRQPSEFEKEKHVFKQGNNCAFCYGNENLTPPEITAVRPPETKPNTPGWSVRVVPNKFPALQIEGDLDRSGIGIYDMSNGIGAHEVIIETPYHTKSLTDLTDEEMKNIVDTYCQRAMDLARDKRFKYILVFKNYGVSAGASLEHTHTQVIALPMVPKNMAEELEGAREYFDYRERCIFCDMIFQEYQDKERIVSENRNFVAFCPFASRFPFEVWIIPKKHNSYFCHSSAEEIFDCGKILKDVLTRVKISLDDPSYNFIIHSAPLAEQNEASYHWHIEVMPKLTRVAGFEWGTGFYVVPTPPDSAAQYLREANP